MNRICLFTGQKRFPVGILLIYNKQKSRLLSAIATTVASETNSQTEQMMLELELMNKQKLEKLLNRS